MKNWWHYFRPCRIPLPCKCRDNIVAVKLKVFSFCPKRCTHISCKRGLNLTLYHKNHKQKWIHKLKSLTSSVRKECLLYSPYNPYTYTPAWVIKTRHLVSYLLTQMKNEKVASIWKSLHSNCKSAIFFSVLYLSMYSSVVLVGFGRMGHSCAFAPRFSIQS